MDEAGLDIASDQMQKRLDAMYQLADRLATIATGALALTVTFRRDMPTPTSAALWMLKASWVAFICTVVGFVLVYLGRIGLHRRLAREAIRTQGRLIRAFFPWYARLGHILLIISFLAGLGLLASYGTSQ